MKTPPTAARPADLDPVPVMPVLLYVQADSPTKHLRSRLFRDSGFQVIDAASAREGLTAATLLRPSVALIDAHLPDSSGVVLCDTLTRLHSGLPVLLISPVNLSAEAQEAGLSAGAHGYVSDAVPAETIVQRISTALSGPPARNQTEMWVVTDNDGSILETSALGARLLSGTHRGLQRRNLIVFFEQDRDAWRIAMSRAATGERVFRSGRLRPKERRPLTVRVQVEKTLDGARPMLLWTFQTDGA
jgi:DNA-binding NarL/FixJ family response regulator